MRSMARCGGALSPGAAYRRSRYRNVARRRSADYDEEVAEFIDEIGGDACQGRLSDSSPLAGAALLPRRQSITSPTP